MILQLCLALFTAKTAGTALTPSEVIYEFKVNTALGVMPADADITTSHSNGGSLNRANSPVHSTPDMKDADGIGLTSAYKISKATRRGALPRGEHYPAA